MSTTEDILLVERRDEVLRLGLNRPERRNAVNDDLIRRLAIAFEDASQDDGIRAIVLTGTGDKAFCSGADLDPEAATFGFDYANPISNYADMLRAARKATVPVIGRINGFCWRAAWASWRSATWPSAASSCQIRPARSQGRPVSNAGRSALMQTMLPPRKFAEMCYTGEMLSADEALRLRAGQLCGAYRGTGRQDRLAGRTRHQQIAHCHPPRQVCPEFHFRHDLRTGARPYGSTNRPLAAHRRRQGRACRPSPRSGLPVWTGTLDDERSARKAFTSLKPARARASSSNRRASPQTQKIRLIDALCRIPACPQIECASFVGTRRSCRKWRTCRRSPQGIRTMQTGVILQLYVAERKGLSSRPKPAASDLPPLTQGSGSDTFLLRNNNRTPEQQLEGQRKLRRLYNDHGLGQRPRLSVYCLRLQL